jgi:uroporphyrinogen decarboxylase
MTAASPTFAGLRVAAFESRRATELAHLIEKLGGQPHVSPSMREVALERNPEAVAFARAAIAGQFDIVIFMTGVGVRHLVQGIGPDIDRQEFLAALGRMTTVARGPKPVAALRELGLQPTLRVPEPNTWRDVLATLDAHGSLAGRRVAVHEYGVPNADLVAGLAARGAVVTTVKVYRWELPEDVGPLEANVRALAAGELDVVLFTSSQQVLHVLDTARRLGLVAEVRRELRRAVIASIGPTTSETLRDQGFAADLEPEHPRMGQLVAAAAERAEELLVHKRRAETVVREFASPAPAGAAAPWHDCLFLRACRREPTERTPIWLMRQAGRYLPEYREIRARTTFLELCKNPALSAEVMLRTVERLGVDAAIIFSDLLPILEPMGLDLEFAHGEGPVIHNPVRTAADVDRVRELDSVEPLDFVMQTVRQTRASLRPDLPVIGFAGAPFTLASYVIEGGGSRNYLHTKALMYRDEGAWHALLSRLARAVGRYLCAQVTAGAQAVQLFDSWAGCLGPEDYRRYVLPHTRAVLASLPAGVPAINFATGNPALLPLLSEAGGEVIGVDWRIALDEAWRLVGPDRGVQGNLDPAVLLADREEIRRRAKQVLDQAAGRPGHIFNLGHGVHPQTPVENVLLLVESVKEMSAR